MSLRTSEETTDSSEEAYLSSSSDDSESFSYENVSALMSTSSPTRLTNTTTWPLKSGNMTQNHRQQLAHRLRGHEFFDIDVLQHYLKIDPNDPSFKQRVVACRQELARNPSVLKAIEALKALEKHEEDGEKQIYLHVLYILKAIERFADATRSFVDSHKGAAGFEDGFPGYPALQPDIILLPRPSDRLPLNGLLWRSVLSAVVVKASSSAGPTPPKTNRALKAADLVAQAADYARLHMSLRPFQLFSICILVYSRHFNVSVFDRGGVMHSPRMDFHGDTEVTEDLVSVALRLLCDLGERDLGRDPTASLVSGAELDLKPYPTYSVGLSDLPPGEAVTSDSHMWRTDGAPIWTSYSLMGRGSAVWRVTAVGKHQGVRLILKTAWRHCRRNTEAAAYEYMREKGIHGSRGIAKFLMGDDVHTGGTSDEAIPLTVNSLRPQGAQLPSGEDIILHRVILESVGKPLWEYDTPATFIRALLAVVEGIGTLSKHGIKHRDISAGNILLSVDPRPGFEAFLTDFEFASYDPSDGRVIDRSDPVLIVGGPRTREKPASTTIIPTVTGTEGIQSEESHQAGPEMTGTVQFMSLNRLAFLLKFIDNRHMNGPPISAHDTKDDLESVFWVAVYALYRRAYQKNQKELANDFKWEFGHASVEDTYRGRRAFLSAISYEPTSTKAEGTSFWRMVKHFDSELVELVPLMAQLVSGQNAGVNDALEVEPDFLHILRGSREAIYPAAKAVPMTCELTRELLLAYADSETVMPVPDGLRRVP